MQWSCISIEKTLSDKVVVLGRHFPIEFNGCSHSNKIDTGSDAPLGKGYKNIINYGHQRAGRFVFSEKVFSHLSPPFISPQR